MPEKIYKSSCCGASVLTNAEIVGARKLDKKILMTQYYVCSKCSQPCNPIIDRTTFKK